MDDDSSVEVEGICSYPMQPEDYEGTFYTESEMESKLTEMQGQPILEEHSGKQIGKVKGGEIKDGQINAFAEISRDTIEGIRAISKLRDGTLKGLSIGHEFLIEEFPDKRVEPKMRGKKIIEISLTSNPDCPTALIKTVGDDSEVWIAKTNYWPKKLRNENLKTDIYKSLKVLQDISSNMTEPAPEKEATPPAEVVPATNEKAADLNEKTKELEEGNVWMAEELRKIRDLLGGQENMKLLVQEQQKKLASNQEQQVKERKVFEEYLTVLADKEPDKLDLLKKAREHLDKEAASNEGGVLQKFLGLAKAQHESSQSILEKKFQESREQAKNEKEDDATKKRKYMELKVYNEPPKETKAPPPKKQKLSEDTSFDNRWTPGKPPAAWRGMVTTPTAKGARSFMSSDNYDSVFG